MANNSSREMAHPSQSEPQLVSWASTGTDQFPCMPRAGNNQNSSKQCWHACIYQARTRLIPCQSNTEAAQVLKSSSVTPGGCSPRSYQCVMRCLGKSDSWAMVTPPTPRGWSSSAVSSMVASGDMHWGQGQNIQGSSSRGGQAPSPEMVQGVPVPSWNGEPQPLPVSPVLCGSGRPPKPSWKRVATEKT